MRMILNLRFRWVSLLTLGSVLATLAGAPATAQQDEVAAARRLAAVASIALAEYAEGVVGGQIVLPHELDEARLFLEHARRTAGELSPAVQNAALPYVQRLITGVAELEPEAELRGELAKLRRVLGLAVGAPLDPMPNGAPSLARGASLYERYCSQCHGGTGIGDGVLARQLTPPPGDLTDPAALRSVPLVEFFRKISVGVAGTAMPPFAEQLDVDDRWAVALYAATLRFPSGLRNLGSRELSRRCADCAVMVSDFSATAMLSDDSLVTVLRAHAGAGVDDSTIGAMVAYARAAGAVEELGGDRKLEAVRTARRVKGVLWEAVAAADSGDRKLAGQRALDAYLVFERIESAIKARDAGAARRVEEAFARFRVAVQQAPTHAALSASQRAVELALDAAVARVTTKASATILLGQSLVIMVREGLEAILIIGALVAVLSKAGAGGRKREIGIGVLAALGASLLTAVGFATLFHTATAYQEILEGLTMLVATAVLFWVSYWLVSKIEVRKWQRFVGAQTQKALSSKRTWALAAVAFLAVYREGFETVLFYAALFTTSDGSASALSGIVAGIVVGLAALAVVYFAMQHYGVRLPLKPFFAVTSALLYVMAFSFAGQGVAELQEAGLISITPLDWLPSVPLLGIFPTTQTILSQLFLAVALAGALVWVFWLEPRAAWAAGSQ